MRTLFVLLGLIPCAGLCGWAVLRHSAAHRRGIERRFEESLGLPVRIDRVEHLRPDVLRLWGCVLSSPAGDAVLAVPVVDLESSATEVRVTIGTAACTPRLARVLAGLAEQWLRQPARFPVDCVVDIDTFSWSTDERVTARLPRGESAGAEGVAATAARLRVECVAGNESRAVRIRRGDLAAVGPDVDEVRIIATADAGGGGDDQPDVRLEVMGDVVSPIPVAILEACVGLGAGGLAVGGDAVASGRVTCARVAGRWSGTAEGRVDRVDLAAVPLGYRLSGEALVKIERVEWDRGRITSLSGDFSASGGVMEQRLIDLLVSAIGCRPGPAFRAVGDESVRDFDEAAGRVRIGATGVDLRAAAGRGGTLAVCRGLALVEEPPTAVPLARVAWVLSPPASVPVPASRATSWLLGLFSDELVAGDTGQAGGGRLPAGQAERPLRRTDF